jgi:hypothetical protein
VGGSSVGSFVGWRRPVHPIMSKNEVSGASPWPVVPDDAQQRKMFRLSSSRVRV